MKYLFKCDDERCASTEEVETESILINPPKEVMCHKCGGYMRRDYSSEGAKIISKLDRIQD